MNHHFGVCLDSLTVSRIDKINIRLYFSDKVVEILLVKGDLFRNGETFQKPFFFLTSFISCFEFETVECENLAM